VLGLARIWREPSAILRALNVVARDDLFLHGLYEQAEACGKELLGAASAYGSLLGQADALTQLASVRMVRGEWLLARQSIQRAEELVGQLGSLHRLRVVVRAMMGEAFGYFLEDVSWPELAASAARLAATPRPGRGAILGLMLGAVAALAYVRSGDPRTARRYLGVITPLLERMPPTMHHHNSAVQVAATAVWELGDRARAPTYRRLARQLVAAGVGDSPSGCTELCDVRMAALLGQARPADWEGVRRHLDATGQRAVRAVADHDEACAMLRAGRREPARWGSLLESAEAAFGSLGMAAWAARCAGLRHSTTPTSNARPPAGLSLREVEVLRLIALGNTTAEIAAALVLSSGTVERHITHIYTKTGARRRAEATAFALKHNLV
jgi:DNA-binding CsgD family transcriptional regulator